MTDGFIGHDTAGAGARAPVLTEAEARGVLRPTANVGISTIKARPLDRRRGTDMVGSWSAAGNAVAEELAFISSEVAWSPGASRELLNDLLVTVHLGSARTRQA